MSDFSPLAPVKLNQFPKTGPSFPCPQTRYHKPAPQRVRAYPYSLCFFQLLHRIRNEVSAVGPKSAYRSRYAARVFSRILPSVFRFDGLP
jgi:hypothetical protein